MNLLKLIILLFFAYSLSSPLYAINIAKIMKVSKNKKFIMLNIGKLDDIDQSTKLFVGSSVHHPLGIIRVYKLSKNYSIWRISSLQNRHLLRVDKLVYLNNEKHKVLNSDNTNHYDKDRYEDLIKTDFFEEKSWIVGLGIENIVYDIAEKNELNKIFSLKRSLVLFDRYRIDLKVVYGATLSSAENVSSEFSGGADLFFNFKLFSLRPYFTFLFGKGKRINSEALSSTYTKYTNGVGFIYNLSHSFDFDASVSMNTIDETTHYIGKDEQNRYIANAILTKLNYNF